MEIVKAGKELTKEEIYERETKFKGNFPNIFVKNSDAYFSAIFKTEDKAIDEANLKSMKEHNYFPMSDFTIFYLSNIATIKRNIQTPFNKLEKEIIMYRMGGYSLKHQIISQIDTREDKYLEVLKYGDKKEAYKLIDERKNQREEENEKFKLQLKEKLILLGYKISKINHQPEMYDYNTETTIKSEILEEQALWGELKDNTKINERYISQLLILIFQNPKNFPTDFVIYNPATDYDKENFDEEFAYNKYEKIINIQRQSASKELSEELQKINFHKAIAISSKLPNNSHYLQIDFKTKSLEEVKETLSKLNFQKGIIINSGNSFHYYNPSIILEKENWINQMEKLKEFESIGNFWPQFQQKQGFSMLRITPSFEKPFYPESI